MTLFKKSIFEMDTVEELKIAMANGQSIHECKLNGFNIYYYAPIELYPFLKENNVDMNISSRWGETYIQEIDDVDKLKFLVDNGMDKLRYSSSPYKKADLCKTKFLLEENIPYKIEDFNDSFLVKQYLFEKNILSEKPTQVTGVNLIRMSNRDFFIFSKNYKELLNKIIEEDKLIENLNYEKLKGLLNNGYNLSKFNYALDKMIEIKDCSLYEIKDLNEAGFNFKINDERVEGLLKFKNENVIDYLLSINNIKDKFFDKEVTQKILHYAKEYIVIKEKRKKENIDMYGLVINCETIEDYKYEYTINLDYLSNKKTIMKNFDLPFKDEILLGYLMKYNKSFLSALIIEKVKTKEDYKMLLGNKYITNYFKKEALLNLSSEKFSEVVRSTIFTDINLELSIEDVFKFIDKKYKIDWLAKDKKGVFLIEKIMNTMYRSSGYTSEDDWPQDNKEYEMILEKIMLDILKDSNPDDVNQFASNLCYLQDMIFLSDSFNIRSNN